MINLSKNTELLLAIATAITLNYVPRLGKVFKGFNTLIHESGHAFMSLLLSGEVVSVDIFYSGEGTATTKSKSWFTRFFVSIAGYPFSSILAFVFAYLLAKGYPDYILYTIISLAVINMIFWVRNPYGLVWLIVTSTLLCAMFYFGWNNAKYYAALLITALILIDAWVSAWHILYLSIKEPKKSGDAKNLQSTALLPAFFWGLFFWIQATFLALMSVHLFYKLPIDIVERSVSFIRSIF